MAEATVEMFRLRSALEAQGARLPAWAEAKARLGRDPLAGELSRTSDQRRADALVDMAARSAGADGTTPARPLFTLVLGSGA